MNDDNFKPMLSATLKLTDFPKLRFPLLTSPKLDGIRAIVRGGRLLTRNLKPVPNRALQTALGRPEFEGLDGELISGSPVDEEVFRRTTSVVMTAAADPEATFHVFDHVTAPNFPYWCRADRLRSVMDRSGMLGGFGELVPHFTVETPEQLLEREEYVLSCGYEGLMVRAPNGEYKYGRGTLTALDLMKLKRFSDAEAYVIGFEEEQRNTNEATKDLLGRTKRTTHKAGKVGKGTLGALRVVGLNGPYKGRSFNVGTGFNAALRKTIWENREEWMGACVKYRYFPSGSKDAPRFPTFVGLRGDL